jgi:hypothetical protein
MADEFSDKDIQTAIKGWRDSATEGAERPEWFWSRQRTRVMSQIREQRGASMPKLAWASLAATIAIAVTLMLPTRAEKQIAPQVKAQQQVQMSDHDLMMAIERSMNAGGPSSLAPAGLLADEMNQALETQVHTQKGKETKYEN